MEVRVFFYQSRPRRRRRLPYQSVHPQLGQELVGVLNLGQLVLALYGRHGFPENRLIFFRFLI